MFVVHFSYLLNAKVVRSTVAVPADDSDRAYTEAERARGHLPGYCPLAAERAAGALRR